MNNQINEISQNIINIQNGIQNSLNDFSKRIRESFQIKSIFAEALKSVSKFIESWPDYIKEYWIQASEMGWYFNWETPASSCIEATREGRETLDSFMVWHLEQDWEKLTNKIIQLCPERKEILQEAFLLHKEKRYIASIPLLFSQIDGVCAQYLGAFLFS